MKKHFAGLGIEPQTSKMNSFESWCLNPLINIKAEMS